MITRRALLRLLSTVVFTRKLTGSAQAVPSDDDRPKRPDTRQFESGDFLWPKTRGAWVPYNSRPNDQGEERERLRWEKQRTHYLDRLRSQPSLTPLERERYAALAEMNFDQFLERYLGDSDPERSAPLAAGLTFYVGHVAVLDVFGDGRVDVIEALDDQDVRRTSYANWIRERATADVWHGRLARSGAVARASITEHAKTFLGRPYDFWNFDLSDDLRFYCSKLVWLSVYRATGLALDDNPQPKRRLWLSPKQCMRSPHVDMIFSPGDYAKP